MLRKCALLILIFFTVVTAVHAESPLIPRKLAIYYGYPSLINGAGGNLTTATDVFNDYGVLVFGNGLQDSGHPDHANTKIIIGNLKTLPNNTVVYGYIPITLSIPEIKQRVDAWAEMGVGGIFVDQAGYDFGVSRQRQNEIVDYVHGKGLSVFINAWNPDDVFSPVFNSMYNPTSETTHLGNNDIYLLESFQIIGGEYQYPADWVIRSDKALAYKNQYGTRIATITTVSAAKPDFDQKKFDYAWWSTLLYGFDAMGWGELNFSALDSKLPFRTRPDPGEIGSAFISPVIHHPPIHRRTTTAVVIEVNTDTHTGRAIPCLIVTKQANPTPVQDGALLTYTLRVTNTSDITFTTTITDILPNQVIPTGVLTWAPIITGPDGVWTQQIVVTVQTGYTGSLINRLEVTTQEGPTGRASITVCANHCIVYLPTILK